MLRCCAGICAGGVETAKTNGSSGVSHANGSNGDSAAKIPKLKAGEQYAPTVSSMEELERYGLEPAPPGIQPPWAATTADFKKNPDRLLLIVPSPSASSWGVWDDTLNDESHAGRGDVVPLVRWAMANRYAVVLFDGKVFAADPTGKYDMIMKHSPARFVTAIVAVHAQPMFREALKGMHSLLYTRLRTVIIAGPVTPYEDKESEVTSHLRKSTACVPEPWMRLDAFTMHQCLFEMTEERVDRWTKNEANKYAGFNAMTENDVPGLKRISIETRIKRLDRNRNDDELARLLNRHEQAAGLGREEEEEEPGVD